MNVKKKCEVSILPTNEKNDINKGEIYLKSHKKGNIDDSLINTKLVIAQKYLDYEDRQNIIFCAGGDVYLKSQQLYILSNEQIKDGDCFMGLKINEISENNKWVIVTPENKLNYIGSGTFIIVRKIIASTDKSLNLPKLSEEFIEKYVNEYNKGNVIKEVIVEYIDGCNLEIDKDNTITIKTIKDNWNREEVTNLLIQSNLEYLRKEGTFDIMNWIEQNL